jgi:cell filamentation protein
MAFSEHYDTMPQQTYTWSSSIKPEASQQNPNSAKLRTFLES